MSVSRPGGTGAILRLLCSSFWPLYCCYFCYWLFGHFVLKKILLCDGLVPLVLLVISVRLVRILAKVLPKPLTITLKLLIVFTIDENESVKAVYGY
jgi:hypothetical protein